MLELTTHVSLGLNRLPPDSTLLTRLPGYEPKSDRMGIGRSRDRSRKCDLAIVTTTVIAHGVGISVLCWERAGKWEGAG